MVLRALGRPACALISLFRGKKKKQLGNSRHQQEISNGWGEMIATCSIRQKAVELYFTGSSDEGVPDCAETRTINVCLDVKCKLI